jgi:hypothetical protein
MKSGSALPGMLAALLVLAGIVALLLLPLWTCRECGGFGEVQSISSMTGTRSDCPRCDSTGRVDLRKYLSPLNPAFH